MVDNMSEDDEVLRLEKENDQLREQMGEMVDRCKRALEDIECHFENALEDARNEIKSLSEQLEALR